MIIEELRINNFGKFSHQGIRLSDGLNVVYGENESGKTTLHAFLHSMLFGLKRQRGKAAKTDLYSLYEPRDGAGGYGGEMVFSCDGKHFSLKRRFGGKQGNSSLVCMDDGEVLSIEKGDLSMLMGNISEAVFENTVSIRQLHAETDDKLVFALQDYIANSQSAVDGDLRLVEAKKDLGERRKMLDKQLFKKKEEAVLEEREFARSQHLLSAEIDKKKRSENQLSSAIAMNEEEQAAYLNNKAAGPWLFFILLVIGIAACAIGGVWALTRNAAAIFAISAVAVGFLVFLFVLMSVMKKKVPQEAEDVGEEIKRFKWDLMRTREERKDLERQVFNLQKEFEDVHVKGKKNYPEELEIEAIKLSMERLDSIAKNMRKKVGSDLTEKTGEILSAITDGKYQKVALDENFKLQILSEHGYVRGDQVSRGTLEQIYFAFRMAAGEVLCEEEKMPVVLDDVFAMYDEERLLRTLRWLAGERRQVVVFTCHRREMEVLKGAGVGFHGIRL